MKQLKEHRDFEIKCIAGSDSSVDVSITCKICNASSSLGMHDKPNSFLISNWTRHAKNCLVKKEKCNDQRTLTNFLKPQATNHKEMEAVRSKNVDVPTNANDTTMKVKDSETSSTGLSNDADLGNNSNDNQQVFRLSPSYCSAIGGDSVVDAPIVAKIDWSRESRKQLAMLKVAMDPN